MTHLNQPFRREAHRKISVRVSRDDCLLAQLIRQISFFAYKLLLEGKKKIKDFLTMKLNVSHLFAKMDTPVASGPKNVCE